MDKNSKILIVGAGPVGLTLHHFLKKEGFLRVRHIDKSLTIAQESRAIGIHSFTLEVILKQLGLTEEFKQRGNVIQRLQFEEKGEILVNIALSLKTSQRRYSIVASRCSGESSVFM